MDPTALPGGTDEDRCDGGHETQVVVGDDELDAGEPARSKRAEEGRPEGPVLGVAHLDAEHLSVAVRSHAGRHDDGAGDHAAVHSRLHIGGVREHVGELSVEATCTKGLQVLVELGADARHLGLGDPRRRPERLHEVVDLSRRDAVHVGLHHDGIQRTVDAPAPLKERGEEGSLPELRDLELEIARLGRDELRSVPVAKRRAGLRALVRRRPDRGGELRLDQLLQHSGERGADLLGELVWRIRDSRVLRSTEFALVGPVVPSEGVGVDGLL